MSRVLVLPGTTDGHTRACTWVKRHATELNARPSAFVSVSLGIHDDTDWNDLRVCADECRCPGAAA